MTKEDKLKAKKDELSQRTGGHELSILYPKEVNFSNWYAEVLKKAELIEYYDISGCYILRPRSFYIWENIQGFLDKKFKALGV